MRRGSRGNCVADLSLRTCRNFFSWSFASGKTPEVNPFREFTTPSPGASPHNAPGNSKPVQLKSKIVGLAELVFKKLKFWNSLNS
jgi:hypothetical protein